MIRARLAPSSDRERIAVDITTDHDADSVLWWDTLSGEPPQVPDRLDAVAIALVPKAMNFGQDLHLEGPVSWTLLANLEEFIDAWSSWLPDLFRPVGITAEEVVDDRFEAGGPQAATGVMAFSGGVDSAFTAFAHRRGLLGRRSVSIASGVMVHGFDIPLDHQDAFALAVASASAITAELDLPLVTMATNWQQVANPDWQMTFGAAIGAVLHLFPDRAGVACMAADNTYPQTTIPWGTNPITGPLLASRRMRLLHSGAGTTRTQKCRAIGELASVREHLRVCWAGDEMGRNCGACEKCIRTKVNFLEAGIGEIPALGPLGPGQVRTVTIGSKGARGIYGEMLQEMDLMPEEIASDLRWVIDRYDRKAAATSAPDDTSVDDEAADDRTPGSASLLDRSIGP